MQKQKRPYRVFPSDDVAWDIPLSLNLDSFEPIPIILVDAPHRMLSNPKMKPLPLFKKWLSPMKHEAPFWETIPRKKSKCQKLLLIFVFLFILSTICLPHDQLLDIIEGAASFTCFYSPHFLSMFDVVVTMSLITNPFSPMLHHVLTQPMHPPTHRPRHTHTHTKY